MFVLQTNAEGENITNENGEIMVLDTDTNSSFFIPESQIEFMQTNVESDNVEPLGNDVDSSAEEDMKEMAKWVHEDILLLINLYKKHEKLFESGIKKKVWQKITNEINSISKKKKDIINVENKWKSLKRTYKNIKIKSAQSGSQRKHWEYFTIMDEILGRRPEIIPQVVASSSSGVIKHSQSDNSTRDEATEPSTSNSNSSLCSTHNKRTCEDSSEQDEDDRAKKFFKKRSNCPNVNDRHREKMGRQDKFLELFEKMIDKM